MNYIITSMSAGVVGSTNSTNIRFARNSLIVGIQISAMMDSLTDNDQGRVIVSLADAAVLPLTGEVGKLAILMGIPNISATTPDLAYLGTMNQWFPMRYKIVQGQALYMTVIMSTGTLTATALIHSVDVEGTREV